MDTNDEIDTAKIAERIKKETGCEGAIVILAYKTEGLMSIKVGVCDLSPIDMVTASEGSLTLAKERKVTAENDNIF